MKKSTFIPFFIIAFFIFAAAGCQQINTDGGNPPQKPTGVTVAAGDASAIVSWDDIGADTYTVYWQAGTTASTSSAGKHASITGLTYTVTGLTNGTQYAFVITGSNSGGESVISNIVTGTPLAAPATPGTITAVSRTTEIDVSWAAVSGATSYDLYYAQGTTVTTSSTKEPRDGPSATLTGLTGNTPYALLVVAKNANGTTTQGTPLAWGTAPTAPTIDSWTITGTDSVTIGWSNPGGATGYRLYSSHTTTPGNVVVTTSSTKNYEGTNLSYPATSLTNGHYYGFSASAGNSYGYGDLSAMKLIMPAPTLGWNGSGPNFYWYWPSSNMYNETGADQYFLIQESVVGTIWTDVTVVKIANGDYQGWNGGTAGYYYRVLHNKADMASGPDGFISMSYQHP
ncbi:MAG: hypothetical protein WCT14_15630 [Treponemataceae bacterium]